MKYQDHKHFLSSTTYLFDNNNLLFKKNLGNQDKENFLYSKMFHTPLTLMVCWRTARHNGWFVTDY
jgi:hypothetical protein